MNQSRQITLALVNQLDGRQLTEDVYVGVIDFVAAFILSQNVSLEGFVEDLVARTEQIHDAVGPVDDDFDDAIES